MILKPYLLINSIKISKKIYNFFSNMAVQLEEVSSSKSFGGFQKVFSHESAETKTKMKFGIYLPPKAATEKCPVVYVLSGLTCTEQNFTTKAGAQSVAAKLGLIFVNPDTSPRGANVEGEADHWDFGVGAGYYVDATEPKWKDNYRMYSYISKELPSIIEDNFPVILGKWSIMGHSVGGHGCLIHALSNPGKYKSASTYSAVTNPMNCPWGIKAFTNYLGENKESWKKYDACELAKGYSGPPIDILCDTGSADGFLPQKQLLPENFVEACSANSLINLNSRMQEGYDHSFYFIASFVEEHLQFHAKHLQ